MFRVVPLERELALESSIAFVDVALKDGFLDFLKLLAFLGA